MMHLGTYDSQTRRGAHRILRAFVVFIALIGLALAAPVAAHGSLSGTWEGVIDIPGQPLEITFRFLGSDDSIVGTADIPAQGAFELALADIELLDGTVRFAFADIPADVYVTFSEDGTWLEGRFGQAGMEFPIRLQRETQSGPDLGQLDALRELITTAMDDWHVPGVAVTVVRDGEVVLAEGFGLRDVDRNLPVTPTTLFGIGSATKAFTSTVFQMLVDEGALRWEQPIREVIPGFRLSDAFATEHASALDFAMHRSGLPRHDIPIVANPKLEKEQFIAAAEHLAPSAGFRTTWQYNNFGYVLLDHMIELASGQSWEDAVSKRILQPLGMDRTTFSITAMQATDDHAVAYAMGEDGWESVPLSELGAAAAAGAINSNAVDLGHWLLFQLNKGRVGSEQLVSVIGMERMQSPHIVIPGSDYPEVAFTGYGLGWMVDSYRGHYRVHHGGNTIGFSADVAFLPEEGIGVAVLSNSLFTPLPGIITNSVLDTMLGLDPIDWNGRYKMLEQMQAEALQAMAPDVGKRHGTAPSHDLAEYAGEYGHPAYGTVAISLVGDALEAVYYDVVIPLQHWHFEQFRGPLSEFLPQDIPFFFVTDATGDVSAVNVGFEPSTKPIVFTRRPSSVLQDVDYLRQFVGEYDLLGQTLEVSLQNDTLILTVPGQPPYQLGPTREARFVFIGFDGFGVEFGFDDDGSVEKAVLLQPHGNVELMRK